MLTNLTVYAMAHASKAIIPLDTGGSSAKRIGVTIGGNMNWTLVVEAYVTGRAKPSGPFRYSIVVLNCKQSTPTSYRFSAIDPQPREQQCGGLPACIYTGDDPLPTKTGEF